MLSFAIPFQPLKSVPGKHAEIVEDRGCIEHPEFSKRGSLDISTQFLHRVPPEEALSIPIPEALDHRE